MARKWEWEDHLTQVLLTKPAEAVQEACQVQEKHGWPVKELKCELYYGSTLCQVVFEVLHYANLIVAHAPTGIDCFNLHHFFKDAFQTVGVTKSCNAHMYTLTPHSHTTPTNLVCLARPSLMW